MQKDDEASSNIKGLIGLPLIVITALLMIMALTSVSSGTFIFALTGGALILISWAMWLICELVASVWERRWIDVAKVISLPFIFAGLVFLSVTEFNYIKLFLIYPSYYPLFDIAQYYTHQPVIIKWDEFNEGFTDLVYAPEGQWQAGCIFDRCSKKRDPELSIVAQPLIGHFYLQDTLWR
ncbi:hypothetical protein [Pantoea ananatis]|uniref:hypothetical protein n=1 Tax=Pantoea ananas TaxID=553 RepID=UPI000B7F430B|nr:hypothetical protein [Pantoea ananatis]MBN6030028.1 hypothetical protein [Pantoea ananatis]